MIPMKWRGHASERCRGCARRVPASPPCPLCPPAVVPEPFVVPEPPRVEAVMVPDGPIAKVLAWVVEDPASRVQAAYDVEEAGTARVTLLAELVALGAVSSSEEPGDGGEV